MSLVLLAVLLFADLLHPVNHLAVLFFLNGYVRHCCRPRGPMPVFLAGGKPHHIAGPDLLDRSAFPLNSAATGCDNESLAEGMCVPCGSRARLESDAGALNKRRIGCLKKRIDPHGAGEPLCQPA